MYTKNYPVPGAGENNIRLKEVADYGQELQSEAEDARINAAIQLRYYGEAGADLLCRALADSSWMVRLYALDSLSWINKLHCLESVANLLRDSDPGLAASAAGLLAYAQEDEVLSYLWPLLEDPDQAHRKTALLALGAFPGSGREEKLHQLMQEYKSPGEATDYALALAEMRYYPALNDIFDGYLEARDQAREKFRLCLATLLEQEGLLAQYSLPEIKTFFTDLENGLPWDLKRELRPAIKALDKNDFEKFVLRVSDFSIKYIAAIFLMIKQPDPEKIQQIDINIFIKESLPELFGESQMAAFYLIGFFNEYPEFLTETPLDEAEEFLWLISTCLLNIMAHCSNLLKEAAEEPVNKPVPEHALVVKKLSLMAGVASRSTLKKVVSCGQPAVPHLIQALKEKEAIPDCLPVTRALSLIGGPEVVEGLLPVYHEAIINEEFELCSAIEDALTRQGEYALHPVIAFICHHDDEGDMLPGSAACAGILTKIRHPEAFAFLCGRLSNEEEDVRYEAIENLVKYDDPAAIPFLLALRHDWSRDVRSAAISAVIDFCESNGVDIPELDALKEEVVEEEEYSDDSGKGDLSKPEEPAPSPKSAVKVGRNDPCPCGSGKKYKKCCGGLF